MENVEQKAALLAPEVLVHPLAKQVTNTKVRVAFQVLAQPMTTQTNREVAVPVNPNVGTVASRVKDFTRMNHMEFHGSKVEEDPQEFIDEVYNGFMITGVTLVEKAELAAYQLKGSSNASLKFNKDRVSNPKRQRGNGSGSSLPMSTCTRCGKKHEGKCLADMDGCFGCGKSGHKMRDFPMLMAKGRKGKQAPPGGSGSNASKQNRFYAL
ncbi:uncharacterized protein LOC125833518 [Solanum verrucosum]|uniref:uncharacterized protein LOC125833518 n=1 Tax=Solanum verrucosum TaxID=315347 RepID=UPI0020D06EC2|nr:uncharacterized protein LOC125833518 [Solanum verrucosum]